MLLFSDGLSLMISRLSLIFNKYFLFSCAKTLKLSKEGIEFQTLISVNLNLNTTRHLILGVHKYHGLTLLWKS